MPFDTRYTKTDGKNRRRLEHVLPCTLTQIWTAQLVL
uniref:Uncharacterized protein n=1 Tax=Arundo donax TaxID=35708 RepID=A0A0A9F3G4_ARUDO